MMWVEQTRLSGGNAVQSPLQKEELRPQRGGSWRGGSWPWPGAHTELGIGPSPLTPAASPGSLSRQGRKQPLGPDFTSEEVNGAKRKGKAKAGSQGKPGQPTALQNQGHQPEAAVQAG